VTKKRNLRSGITTGASAAAAAQAAVIKLFGGEAIQAAKIINPKGQEIIVPIKEVLSGEGYIKAVVIKDGGDDPDVTNGLEIVVTVARIDDEIIITGGTGVGIVTKPGMQVPIGEPAINPVPRQMIIDAVKSYIPEGAGVKIEVSVPKGEETARKTLNPKLGIIGGISILGTTGIVEPMSEEALKRSLVPQVEIAKALGYTTVCLTPGRLGEKWVTGILGIPSDAVILMSNFVGFLLRTCAEKGMKSVLLAGHHSKLTKVAAGCFQTHNKVSDGRLETLAAHAALMGAGPEVVKALLEANTSEEALGILRSAGYDEVMSMVADRAAKRAGEHVFGELKVGVAMFTMSGEVLAVDDNAREIGREMGWQI
jgi:cobalt-precorrin-5B (C1)-methyltransferase